jgi:hypothetical protein
MLLFLFLFSVFAQADDKLPPKVLFHMGHKPFMEADGKLGNIPEDVWEHEIMGSDTRYGLVPFRRGLYGGEEFDNLELYANLFLGSDKIPWMMKITLNERCRNPKAVNLQMFDSRYAPWVIAHVNEILKSAQDCLNPQATDCWDLLLGFNAIAYGKKENPCDALQSQFLADTKAKIVKDGDWEKSWYIRDRACVQKIESSPQTVLETLAEAKWDWHSRRSTHSGTSGGAYGMSAISMLVSALSDSPQVDPKLLQAIRTKTAQSDIHFSFEANSREWIKEFGPAVIDSYSRCESQSQQARFRELASDFESALHSITYENAPDLEAKFRSAFQSLCR